MSARSRARKNKRRNLVPAWDLMIARTNHNWGVLAKKARKLTGLYPVMFNPRQNGRLYSRRMMLKALGAGPIPVRGFNGETLRGVLAHPTKANKDGSVMGNIRVGHREGPTGEWLKHMLEGAQPANTCFSVRAITDGDKQPKQIISWNLTECNDPTSEAVNTHMSKLREWMGISPEVLNVDPSMLGREHGEFGGLCVPPKRSESEMAKDWEKSHYSKPPHQHVSIEPVAYASLLSPQRQQESKTPQSIIDFLHGTTRPVDPRELVEVTVPFEAKSTRGQVNAFAERLLKNISSIEGECEEPEPRTATELLQMRVLLEKQHERELKDIAQLQDLLGANRKPFDDFYLNAPITVYEFPERCLDIKPNGEWFPNTEIFHQFNELKVPHKSGPYMLAAVAANEYEEFREHLEKVGYAKLKVTRNVVESTTLGDGQLTETRYFVFIVNWVAKASDPYGFRLDTRPTGLSDMMLKHILIHGETYGNK